MKDTYNLLTETLDKIKSTADLVEVFSYVQPIMVKSFHALNQNSQNHQISSPTHIIDVEDTRKLENILARDFPSLISDYLAMPLDYRNEKSLKNNQTHREILISNLEILVQALLEIEAKNLEAFDKKAFVQSRALKEKYEVEVEPENKFSSQFDWDMFQKNTNINDIKNNAPELTLPLTEAKTPEIVPAKKTSTVRSFISHLLLVFQIGSKYKKVEPHAQLLHSPHFPHIGSKYKIVNKNIVSEVSQYNSGQMWPTDIEFLKEKVQTTHAHDMRYYMNSLIKRLDKIGHEIDKKYMIDHNQHQEIKQLTQALNATIKVMYQYDGQNFKPGNVWFVPESKNSGQLGRQAVHTAIKHRQTMIQIKIKALKRDWSKDYQNVKDMFKDFSHEEKKYYLKLLIEDFQPTDKMKALVHSLNENKKAFDSLVGVLSSDTGREMANLHVNQKNDKEQLLRLVQEYAPVTPEDNNWNSSLVFTLSMFYSKIKDLGELKDLIEVNIKNYDENNPAYIYAIKIINNLETSYDNIFNKNANKIPTARKELNMDEKIETYKSKKIKL